MFLELCRAYGDPSPDNIARLAWALAKDPGLLSKFTASGYYDFRAQEGSELLGLLGKTLLHSEQASEDIDPAWVDEKGEYSPLWAQVSIWWSQSKISTETNDILGFAMNLYADQSGMEDLHLKARQRICAQGKYESSRS